MCTVKKMSIKKAKKICRAIFYTSKIGIVLNNTEFYSPVIHTNGVQGWFFGKKGLWKHIVLIIDKKEILYIDGVKDGLGKRNQ